MTNRIEIAGLRVAGELFTFIADEALPGTGIGEIQFWKRFAAIVTEMSPRNRALLARRDALQAQLDGWYRQNGAPADMAAYKAFLTEIGYLVPEPAPFPVCSGMPKLRNWKPQNRG